MQGKEYFTHLMGEQLPMEGKRDKLVLETVLEEFYDRIKESQGFSWLGIFEIGGQWAEIDIENTDQPSPSGGNLVFHLEVPKRFKMINPPLTPVLYPLEMTAYHQGIRLYTYFWEVENEKDLTHEQKLDRSITEIRSRFDTDFIRPIWQESFEVRETP